MQLTVAFAKAWLDQPHLYSNNSYQLLFKPTLRYSTFVIIFNTSFSIKYLYRLTNRYCHAFTNAQTLHATCLKFGFINSNQLLYLDTTQFFSQSTETEILFSNYLQSNFNFIGTKSVLTKKLFCFIKHFCCCCLNNFIFSSSVHVTSVFVSAVLTSRAISFRKNI